MYFNSLSSENNEQHHEKWKQFKERNILRKMDIALNTIPLSCQELLHATPEQLKRISNNERNGPDQFKIEVPSIPEEFPDLSTMKAKIYPLPISHENQCKTFGLGRNLDLFAEEFNFTNERKEKFLPLLKNKKFNLQLAYERYAFIKGMEKPKKDQRDYEKFLRNNETHLSDEFVAPGEDDVESEDSDDLEF